jgi:hypothetical protein
MDVTQLPYNKFIGLELAPVDSGFLISLPDDINYTNHLGSVHASAMLAVAEAGSGVYLSQQFAEYSGAIPVVRRIEAKFRKPGFGKLLARCTANGEDVARWQNELAIRGRVLVSLPVEVVDSQGVAVMSAMVDWFISNAKI